MSLSCECCDYYTNVANNYLRHLKSSKHMRYSNDLHIFDFNCNVCLKGFSSTNGMYKHQKLCIKRQKLAKKASAERECQNDLRNTMKADMRELMQELLKPTTTNVINNNNSNNISINQTNNINIFLNQNCSNVINLSDLISSFDFPRKYFSNLYYDDGYVDKNVQLFRDHINKLPILERPIHCIEGEGSRQEILHFRHNDEWKDEAEVDIMKQIYSSNIKSKSSIAGILKSMDDGILLKMDEYYSENVRARLCAQLKMTIGNAIQDNDKKKEIIDNIIRLVKTNMEQLQTLLDQRALDA